MFALTLLTLVLYRRVVLQNKSHYRWIPISRWMSILPGEQRILSNDSQRTCSYRIVGGPHRILIIKCALQCGRDTAFVPSGEI